MNFFVVGLALVGAFYLLSFAVDLYGVVSDYVKKAKEYYRLKGQHDDLIKKGIPHKWVELLGPDGKTKIMVCENTGWCPSRKGFLPKASIQTLKNLEKEEQEWADFQESAIQEIADLYQIDKGKILEIHGQVKTIKVRYAINKMRQSISEIKETTKQ